MANRAQPGSRAANFQQAAQQSAQAPPWTWEFKMKGSGFPTGEAQPQGAAPMLPEAAPQPAPQQQLLQAAAAQRGNPPPITGRDMANVRMAKRLADRRLRQAQQRSYGGGLTNEDYNQLESAALGGQVSEFNRDRALMGGPDPV